MRLRIDQFRFLRDGDGFKCCTLTSTKALARIVPDKTYAGMWRIVRPDRSLSDMLNIARAKDVAFGMAETAIYLGKAA